LKRELRDLLLIILATLLAFALGHLAEPRYGYTVEHGRVYRTK
jgi:hypothetical protein